MRKYPGLQACVQNDQRQCSANGMEVFSSCVSALEGSRMHDVAGLEENPKPLHILPVAVSVWAPSVSMTPWGHYYPNVNKQALT